MKKEQKKKSTLVNVRGHFFKTLTLQKLVEDKGTRRLQKAWVVGSAWASSKVNESKVVLSWRHCAQGPVPGGQPDPWALEVLLALPRAWGRCLLVEHRHRNLAS